MPDNDCINPSECQHKWELMESPYTVMDLFKYSCPACKNILWTMNALPDSRE